MVKTAVKRIYIGKYLVLGFIALLVLGFVIYYAANASKRDEVRIKNVLTDLAGNLSKTPQESTATALLKVKSIAGAFDCPMTFGMDHYAAGSYDSDRLFASVGRYRTLIKKANVTASDISVELLDKTRAKVFFSGRFAGELKNGMSDTIIKDIEAEFIKINKHWRIKSMKFRNVLH
ncbi:MAG: hypothetical protein IKA65_04540 [Lentisphaeria bacterium]|nr:hypothetical protein [Lentisphaeria bacterium]